MIDVHLHLPAGAQKKDGPSAGVAMVRTRTFLPSNFGCSMREWVGLRDRIALDGQVRPTDYGNDRRGACAPPAPQWVLI